MYGEILVLLFDKKLSFNRCSVNAILGNSGSVENIGLAFCEFCLLIGGKNSEAGEGIENVVMTVSVEGKLFLLKVVNREEGEVGIMQNGGGDFRKGYRFNNFVP